MAEVTRITCTSTTQTKDEHGNAREIVSSWEEIRVSTDKSAGLTAWRIIDLAETLHAENCPNTATVTSRNDGGGDLIGIDVSWKKQMP